MRTILAIWHQANKGKSETLREFSNLLLLTYPTATIIFPTPGVIPAGGDFRLIVEIHGIIVGVETSGDPGTNLEQGLIDLADNFHCTVILCTTRTSGQTVHAVDQLVFTRGYNVIWTSTYQVSIPIQYNFVNQQKARHIFELLQGLGVI